MFYALPYILGLIDLIEVCNSARLSSIKIPNIDGVRVEREIPRCVVENVIEDYGEKKKQNKTSDIMK